MGRKEKILVSTLALIFSAGAVGIGYALVGDNIRSFPLRFVCDFFFLMQFLTTIWVVIAVFRKKKESDTP